MNHHDSLKQEAIVKTITDEFCAIKSESSNLSLNVFHKLCYFIDFGFYELYT